MADLNRGGITPIDGTDVAIAPDQTRLLIERQGRWQPWLSWCPKVLVWGVNALRRSWYMIEIDGLAIRVSSDALRDGTAWEQWAVSGYDGQRNRDRLASVVRFLARDLPSDAGKDSPGWWEINGQWAYVTAGESISASGPVPGGVDAVFDNRIAKYALPAPLSGEELQQAAFTQLRLLDLADLGITGTLMATTALAPLYSWFREHMPAFSVLLIGKSGLGKSELATLFMRHFAPDMTPRDLPGITRATENWLAQIPHLARDSMFVLDDYAGGASDPGQELKQARALTSIVHAMGNGTGKGRLSKDITAREPEEPRGVGIATGEKFPPSAARSTLARSVPLELSDSIITKPDLTPIQRDSKVLAGVHAAYIQWQAARLDQLRGDPIDELFRQWRSYLGARYPELAAIHGRVVSNCAHLMLAFDQWCEFVEQAAQVSIRDTLRNEYERELVRTFLKFGAVFEDSEPAKHWVYFLGEAFQSGLGHLEGPGGRPPQDCHQWGWTMPNGANPDALAQPRGTRFGWLLDSGDLLLNSSQVYERVSQLAANAEMPFGFGPETLHKELAKEGAIEVRYENRKGSTGDVVRIPRYTVKASVGPREAARGLRVRRDWWEMVTSDGGSTPPTVPDSGSPGDVPQAPPRLAIVPNTPEPAHTPHEPAAATPTPTRPVAVPDSPEPAPQPQRHAERGAAPERGQRGKGKVRNRLAAVLAADGLWLQDRPDPVRVMAPADIGEAYELAVEHGVRQLWIHPNVMADLGLPETKDDPNPQVPQAHPWANAEGYRVGNEDTPALSAWVKVTKPGVKVARSIVLVAWESRIKKGWRAASTGRVLLSSILALSQHLKGSDYYYSPNQTSKGIITKKLASGTAGVELTPIGTLPFETKDIKHPSQWSRALGSDEDGQTFLQRFDLRGQQLATWSVPLGVGKPVRITDFVWNSPKPEDKEKSPKDRPTYGRTIPAYHRVSLDDGFRPDMRLPDPVRVWEYAGEDGTVWVPTPTVELLIDDLGAPVTIHESIVWTEHAAWLESSMKLFRGAHNALASKRTDAEEFEIAYQVNKAIYTSRIGAWVQRGIDERSPEWFRPDVRDMIISKAIANDYRRMQKIGMRSGRWPVATYKDAVYYTSTEADPRLAAPVGMVLGDKFGEYQHEVTLPLAEFRNDLGELNFQARVKAYMRKKGLR